MPRVNPEILEWARETAGLTPVQAVKKIQLSAARGHTALERLEALESGEEQPTRAMLTRMAKQYRRPLVTFYLSSPPRAGDRGHDFRTLPPEHTVADDAYLDALIRGVRARQSMVRSVLEEEDEAEVLPFVGVHTMDEGVDVVVHTLRQTLPVDLAAFRGESDQHEAFARLREGVESVGVFVLLMGDLGSHHSAINLGLFRGFALADPIAPFIVINDRDSRAAWCFTLLHEMTHLLLGQTGVSGQAGGQEIEVFCNDVASEFLLPHSEMAGFRIGGSQSLEETAGLITDYARARKISSSLVAYRLYRDNRLDTASWRELRHLFRSKWRQRQEARRAKARSRDGGPSYYVVRKHRLGMGLLRLVDRMMASGALSTSRAGFLLGLKPPQVERLLEARGNSTTG